MFTADEVEAVIEAERWHELIANRCVHNADGTRLITNEFDSVEYIDQLFKTAKAIANSKTEMSKMTAGSMPRFTLLGNKLYLACKDYRKNFYVWQEHEMVPRYPDHKFNPYLDFSLKQFAEVESAVDEAIFHDDQYLLHRTISEVASKIRRNCNTSEFKNEVNNYKRNARAKFKRALHYLLGLFRKRSRLLILRIDLYVHKENLAQSYSPEVWAAYDQFLDDLANNRILEDVIGWMGAREAGIERGVHYHLLVAVDGHEHRAGASLTEMLGEHWKKCMPAGVSASYFNCFARVKEYLHLGIGMVHRRDARKLLGLYFATRYLFKDEVQLVVKGEGKGSRNFRRGEDDEDYLGEDDDVGIVRQVFFGNWPNKPGKAP